MATTGGSAYVLNIVELQNTITSASGLSPVASLSNTVAQIQQMVIFDEKRIATNTISKYDTSPIQVTDSMNFASNTALTINGTSVASGTGTSLGQVSSIGYQSSFTNYFSTNVSTDTAISFQVGAPATTPITINAGGLTTISGPLTLTGTGTPGLGYYLTCMDSAGTAEWPPARSISDQRWKTNIEQMTDSVDILQRIRGVRFRWSDGGARDIGVIAQDLMAVLPEAVIEGVEGRPFMVQYNKIIPVLVEALKEMHERVKVLEAANVLCRS